MIRPPARPANGIQLCAQQRTTRRNTIVSRPRGRPIQLTPNRTFTRQFSYLPQTREGDAVDRSNQPKSFADRDLSGQEPWVIRGASGSPTCCNHRRGASRQSAKSQQRLRDLLITEPAGGQLQTGAHWLSARRAGGAGPTSGPPAGGAQLFECPGQPAGWPRIGAPAPCRRAGSVAH